jgi:LysM repeat protein
LNRDVFHYRRMQNQDYITRKGDTLAKISETLGIDLKELLKETRFTAATLYPNQMIVIPRRVENGSIYFEEYAIQYNDSVNSIAGRYSVPQAELMRYNDFTRLQLTENQVLRLPLD